MKLVLQIVTVFALAIGTFANFLSQYLINDGPIPELKLEYVPEPDSEPELRNFLESTKLPAEFNKYKVIDQAIAYHYYDNNEFIFVDRALKWNQANLFCQNKFKGHLAIINDMDKADFLLSSLEDDNMGVNELIWVNGKYRAEHWTNVLTRETHEEISMPWLEEIVVADSIYSEIEDKHCLAFTTNSYNKPVMMQSNCWLSKRFVCERPATPDLIKQHSLHETHTGWIDIGLSMYKIFHESTTYDEAAARCTSEDDTATLASPLTAYEMETLGRYMLITRPQIRLAWVGAVYVPELGYVFPNSELGIPINANNDTTYPHYLEPRPPNQDGICLAIKRLPKGEAFKEMPCNATAPGFICTRAKETRSLSSVLNLKINCANKGYTLSDREYNWQDASKYCESQNEFLAEPRTMEEVECLSYMMTEIAPSPIRNIWINSRGNNNGHYFSYPSDKSKVHVNEELWLFELDIDLHLNRRYTCLNLDKLNLNQKVFYGTECFFKQRFICEAADVHVPTADNLLN